MTGAGDAVSRAGLLAGLPLLEDLPDVAGGRVLVRVDYNVPLHDGQVIDDFRIRASLDTIGWLTSRGAKVTTATHLGRPKGHVDPAYDVAPVRRRLAELAPGVELLENLRFDPGEEACDPAFVERLVDDFDAYVNDAFGASHRAHASIVGPPARLPSAAGRLVQREVTALGRLITSPDPPFVAVVGGAKVGDKLGVLRALADKVDTLVVGGAMAFTFLAASGRQVGASLCEAGQVEACGALAQELGERLLLPSDLVVLAPGGEVARDGEGTGEVAVTDGDVAPGWQGLDIGPETAARYATTVRGAATVFWNGPMGVFEDSRFAAGTTALARAMAACPGFTVVGGGDSVAALDELGLADSVSFVSTGGGASLELIEHGDLPGLAALRAASNAPRAGS